MTDRDSESRRSFLQTWSESLPRRQREVVEAVLRGASIAEISAASGMSRSCVRQALAGARRRLAAKNRAREYAPERL